MHLLVPCGHCRPKCTNMLERQHEGNYSTGRAKSIEKRIMFWKLISTIGNDLPKASLTVSNYVSGSIIQTRYIVLPQG